VAWKRENGREYAKKGKCKGYSPEKDGRF